MLINGVFKTPVDLNFKGYVMSIFRIVTILDQTDVVLTSPPNLRGLDKVEETEKHQNVPNSMQIKTRESEIWRQILPKESYCTNFVHICQLLNNESI